MPDVRVRGSGRIPIGGYKFYVATDGNDSNPGTRAQPFLTIGRARTAVRSVAHRKNGNTTVYLRGGRYILSSTETFTPADSGNAGHVVTWRSYSGETASISGGTQITGWSDQGGGLWRASTTANFRQLYVNDVRATRCRFPKAGTYGELAHWNTTDQQMNVEAGHADELALAQEMTIIGEGVNNCTFRIASVSGVTVTPDEPERTRLQDQEYPPQGANKPYFFQGGLDLCTAQGEWHLDTVNDFVYYRPLGGENMATAQVFAPLVERLISVEGSDLNTPVHDIEFYGLTFEHSTWMLPSTEGYVGDQASTYFIETLPVDQISSYPSPPVPSAVHFDTADNIRIERCVFKHCGAGGLTLHRAVTDATIIGNVFYDCSGSGVSVDTHFLGNTADSRIPCRRVTVSNNYIKKIGQEFYCSVGIFFGYVDSGIIEQNETTDLPYCGISVGWGWENSANNQNGNIVRRNEVWAVCKLESDSAGIYTLSKQANGASPVDGLIEHNYIHDIIEVANVQGGFNISGIYLDMGSNNWDVQNNVLVNTADTEVFTNLPGGQNSFSNNDSSDGIGVIDNAGLITAYEDIRNLVP